MGQRLKRTLVILKAFITKLTLPKACLRHCDDLHACDCVIAHPRPMRHPQRGYQDHLRFGKPLIYNINKFYISHNRFYLYPKSLCLFLICRTALCAEPGIGAHRFRLPRSEDRSCPALFPNAMHFGSEMLRPAREASETTMSVFIRN